MEKSFLYFLLTVICMSWGASKTHLFLYDRRKETVVKKDQEMAQALSAKL